MKKITSLFIMSVLVAVGGYSIAAAQGTVTCQKVTISSWRGCEPVVETRGTVSTDKYSAVVNVFYSSMGADYNTSDFPLLSVEYGLVADGSFDMSTDPKPQSKGNETVAFFLNGLDEGKTYQYRAVLSWVGGVKYGEVKKFQAIKKITTSSDIETVTVSTGTSGTSSSGSTQPKTSTTSSGSTTSTSSSSTPKSSSSSSSSSTSSGSTTGIFSLFGGSTKSSGSTVTSVFNNIDEKSGFRLAIDNGKTEVRTGDTVTVKVRYENNNTKSFTNGSVEIFLPDQYTITATNKGIIDKVSNAVVISLRDFPAGAFGTAVVTAQATGKSGDFDQAMTQAGMKIGGVVLKVADIDEYIVASKSSSSSKLGASASGTGMLPGTIIGWLLLLIILAAIVIIGRRYFMKKDY